MASLEEGILVVVDAAAELASAEVFDEILLAHEEGTVFFIGPASLLLRLGCPAVRGVAPVAVPLEVTPRIPQLEQLDSVAELVGDLHAADETVGVITDQAELLQGLDRSRGRTSGCSHDPVFRVGFLDAIPERFIAGLDDFGRRACQITQHIFGKTGFDALVTAVQLGPGFLQQDDPELVTFGLGERRVILPAWNVVINDHFFPLAIFADP